MQRVSVLVKGNSCLSAVHFGYVEQVLRDIIAIEPLHDKVQKAAGDTLPFMRLHEIGLKGKSLACWTDGEVELFKRAEEGRFTSH